MDKEPAVREKNFESRNVYRMFPFPERVKTLQLVPEKGDQANCRMLCAH